MSTVKPLSESIYQGANEIRNQMNYWPVKDRKVLSSLGEKAANILGELVFGFNHWPSRIKLHKVEWDNELHIEVPFEVHELATYDFNVLTRLVILAHDANVRVTLWPSGKRFSIGFMKYDDHPSLEAAAKTLRDRIGNQVE